MKFQPDQLTQTITAYGPGWISVDADKITTSSVIISARGQRIAWDCSRFEDLTPAHFCATGRAGRRGGDLWQRRAQPLPRPPGCSR